MSPTVAQEVGATVAQAAKAESSQESQHAKFISIYFTHISTHFWLQETEGGGELAPLGEVIEQGTQASLGQALESPWENPSAKNFFRGATGAIYGDP